MLKQFVKLSEYYLPTLREVPSDATIASHRYMLRAGMIKQSASGLYSWLPLGFRVLKKIEQIVREEQDKAGATEILMSTIQSADLWRESGRYDDYGLEMLRIKDRHERELLYGPTNEEVITAIMRDGVKSYRDLPQMLYHIQWKFRDEMRPRFGVMRGREFYMKDGYSFDYDTENGLKAYNRMFVSYLRTFARMGLTAIPMQADTGPIGGENSHEFIILAKTGESQVFCDKRVCENDIFSMNVDYQGDLNPIIANWTNFYAATEEKHDENVFNKIPKENQISARGIEVGHIFFFGDKYSKPLGAKITNPQGEQVFLQSGSYGIGVSRLCGAIIEACHDDMGIQWPIAVAPFQVGVINLKVGDSHTDKLSQTMIDILLNAGVEVLYDDRDLRAGEKFADMDLMGIPLQIIIGPKSAINNECEMKDRRNNEKSSGAYSDICAKILAILA